MKEADMMKDILQFKMFSQANYNENLLDITNPEVRQLFTQLRDDETRAVVKLQQKISRMESKARVIARILPAKNRF